MTHHSWAFFVVACLSLPAFAGDLDNFASCTKSNDCKSKQCFEKRCEPSGFWNGHGKEGSHCEGDGNCASHNCDHRQCAPKKEEKKASTGARAPEQPPSSPTRRPERAAQPRLALNECGKDLRATVFADDFNGEFATENDQMAADVCARYDARTIGQAKVLEAAHYGLGFPETCREIEGKSDAEIACGKKYFDSLPRDQREVAFKIPVSCSTPLTRPELERCVKDLASVKVPAATAKTLCNIYDASTLARAQRLAAGGYTGDFAVLTRQVDHHSDEEIECAKKELDRLFADDPHGYEFSVSFECSTPIVKH